MVLEVVIIRLIIGAVAGTLADLVVGDFKIGLLGAVIVGVIGAILGSWVLAFLGIRVGTGLRWDVMVSFLGAVMLLILLRMLRQAV